MRGIVENLESILFDVFFDDILKEKEVEEMKYEEMWFEIKHYLEDYIDSHETITEKIHFTKKQLTMIQRLLKNPYAILLNLKHLNPTQQDMISTCISPSDINYIKDIVKPTTIVKENSSEKSYAFSIWTRLASYYESLFKDYQIKVNLRKGMFQYIAQARMLVNKMNRGMEYRFSKKDQEVISSVLNHVSSEDKERYSKMSERFFALSEERYINEQEKKKLKIEEEKTKKTEKNQTTIVVEQSKETEPISEEPAVLDTVQFQDYVEDQIYEQDQERYWYHITHIESIDQLSEILPKHDYSNYREVMKYLLNRLDQEIKEYMELVQTVEDEDIDQHIIFLSNLFEKMREDFISYYQEDGINTTEEDLKLGQNRLFFIEKPSGIPYICSDLDHSEFTKERVEVAKKLLLQLANNTYMRDEKHFKKIKNNQKVSRYFPIYELKEYQTRILFTYLGKGDIAVLMAFCKKENNSYSLLNIIGNRMSDCAPRVQMLKEQIGKDAIEESYLKEQEELGRQLTK